MTNFLRAVRLALRQRWTLTGVVVCSFAVALLWGANIGTIYPFIEVVFDGQDLHEWLDEKSATAARQLADYDRKVVALEADLLSATEGQERELRRELRRAQARRDAERQSQLWLEWLRPVIERYAPHSAFQTLLLIVGMLLIGTALKDLFLVQNMILVERMAQVATFDLRGLFYRRALRMDLGAFGQDRTTGLVSRFTHDMAHVHGALNTLFGRFLREPLKMLACFIGAAMISWRLLLISMLTAPIAILVIRQLSRSLKRASRRAMEEMTNLYAVLSETFGSMEAVKAYTMERYERRRFHLVAKKYLQKSMRIVTYNALIHPATEILGMGVICLGILAGGSLIMHSETRLLGIPITDQPLDRGSLMTFFALLIGMSDPARKLADVYSLLQRGAAAADRIYEMVDRVPAIQEPSHPVPAPSPPREIIFDGVSFHYTPDQPVLVDVDLRIRTGETVAVVGPNGCGKSTLAALIPRFYDPTSGRVRLDQVDLREVRLRDLRRQIGLVTQKTLLFDDTVLNNIRYGSLAATDEQVIAAARQAHAHQFIETKLEHGYHTVVGEQGSRLSGGQRQRIALARAILRNPQILILDEATSQVDLESEQLIHQALRDFVRNRTTLMITHRLTSLELADRIVVMNLGRIIAVGSHSELQDTCEFYRRLFQIGLRESA